MLGDSLHLGQIEGIEDKLGSWAVCVACYPLREGVQLLPVGGLLFVVLLLIGVLQLLNGDTEAQVTIRTTGRLYQRSSLTQAVPLQQPPFQTSWSKQRRGFRAAALFFHMLGKHSSYPMIHQLGRGGSKL